MLNEQDKAKLMSSFHLWPQRLSPYGYPEKEPDFTRRIEDLGNSIRAAIEKRDFVASNLRHFLLQVGYWKMPRQSSSHEGNVRKNSDEQILRTFLTLASTYGDGERISACNLLYGFGRGTGQTRMASAVLRFLWPEQYGVIDWRNWAVLSNCEYQFLSKPQLQIIGNTRSELRNAVYDIPRFLLYTDTLRTIGSTVGLSKAAEMDLALYSYSAEIWPFPRLEECLFTIAENRLNSIGSSNISLKQIYETYWEEWNRLKSYPATEQKAMKIAFLRSCLEVTPKNIFVWDEATQLKLPYHLKHDRDLTRLEQKIQELSPTRAVQELDSFMWNMRLKGDGYGVL